LSPTTALEEWERLPLGVLEEVIEARTYARAKATYDSATTADARNRLPTTELMTLVKVNTFELVQAEIDESHG
jgi:hypothetical protein